MGKVIRIEIKIGTKDRNLMMTGFFEETSNCNPKSHTRVPTMKEKVSQQNPQPLDKGRSNRINA